MKLVFKLDHPIRKLTHFTEYFILAVFLFGAVDRKGRKLHLRWLIPWGIATFYAVTDELHQYFIPGRSCQVGDVMIDSAGACVGVLVVMGIVHLLGRKRAC